MEQKCIQLIEKLLDDPEMKVLPAEEIVKDYLTQKYKESLYDERQYMSSQVPHFSNWNKEKPMELLMVCSKGRRDKEIRRKPNPKSL